MIDGDKRRRFVELRSGGMSYVRISREIGVCKNTLVKWSRELCDEIKNAKAMELEALREEYLVGREYRLRVLGTELNQISQEILKRDLGDVATWRLYEMQRKVLAELDKDNEEVEFVERKRKDALSLKDMFVKTEKWFG